MHWWATAPKKRVSHANIKYLPSKHLCYSLTIWPAFLFCISSWVSPSGHTYLDMPHVPAKPFRTSCPLSIFYISFVPCDQYQVCIYAQSLSCVRLFATLWTIACQAPLSIEFSTQEYWSELIHKFNYIRPLGDLNLPTCMVTLQQWSADSGIPRVH